MPNRSGSLRGWLAAAHLGPSLACTAFTALSGWAAARAGGGRGPRIPAFLAPLAMALAQVSTGSLNDVADHRADVIHQPYKPIPRGEVTRPAVLAFALGTGAGSLLVASMAGTKALRIMALGLTSGWSYDLWLRRTPLSWAPFAVGIGTVPLLGPAALGLPPVRPRLLLAMAGLLGVALHLANGGPDAARDRAAGRRSLPVLLGVRGSRLGAHATLTGAAALSVASSPDAARGWALRGAGAGLGLLAVDRAVLAAERRPGQYPFVLPVLAAGAIAAGWLVGAAGAGAGR
jgi:4-hydroxybenzoate polyprenyltransferase